VTYLIPTHIAALALDIPEEQLERWAEDGLVTPAHDQHGVRLWDIDKLREQIKTYIDRPAPDQRDS